MSLVLLEDKTLVKVRLSYVLQKSLAIAWKTGKTQLINHFEIELVLVDCRDTVMENLKKESSYVSTYDYFLYQGPTQFD